MIYILNAMRNPVSSRVGEVLKNKINELPSIEMWEVDSNVLDFPHPPDDTEYLIVPSTHRSKTSKPCLTVHTPGNWTTADMGGEPNTLPYANNVMIKTLLSNLAKYNTTGWDVSLEVDHHGPTYDVPITFVEIGSSEKEWSNDEAIGLLVKVIIESLRTPLNPVDGGSGVFAVGGSHYAPKFTRLELNEPGLFIGHILPSYKIDDVSYDIFVQGIEKTMLKTDRVIFDWKGLKSRHKQKIINFCDEYGIKWEKK